MGVLSESLPVESFQLVADTVQSLLTTRREELLGVGLLVALWSGSMGIGSIITTINRAYNIRPRRSLVEQKLLAIVLTICGSG